MGRRTNYGFEKRQKELKRLKKREKKLEARRLKKEGGAAPESAEGPDAPESAEGPDAPDTGGASPSEPKLGEDARD